MIKTAKPQILKSSFVKESEFLEINSFWSAKRSSMRLYRKLHSASCFSSLDKTSSTLMSTTLYKTNT